MKDGRSAEEFRERLEALRGEGLFRQKLQGDPKNPRYEQLSFLTAGSYLLVAGDQTWVDAEIENIRLMAFLYERPRAHMLLNVRVVQLTGPANTDVIQMTETVRALVDTQRREVVRAFHDLQRYLLDRLAQRTGDDLKVYEAVRRVMPSLADGSSPLTVPEILLLLMLDRTLPSLPVTQGAPTGGQQTEHALLAFSRRLESALRDPAVDDDAAADQIQPSADEWARAVSTARAWCEHYAQLLDRKDDNAVGMFRAALQQAECPLPPWVTMRLRNSVDLTERLHPGILRQHIRDSLRELERRFQSALVRTREIRQGIARAQSDRKPSSRSGQESKAPVLPGYVGRQLLALKSVADGLVSVPLALFEAVAAALDDTAPTASQLTSMFDRYAKQRTALDARLASTGAESAPNPVVDYAKLENLEAGVNLWLRRASEAMSRALEQQFYNRYVEELRLLANQQLRKTSNREVLAVSPIEDVPDVARDILLADTGVNVFVSNSISLQFAPETTNSVSAGVQGSLPSRASLLDRVKDAGQAAGALEKLSSQYGIPGDAIVKALMAGGEAVPVQAGISLSAKPTVGFDASTVTLELTANQTLQPNSDKVADRVTKHAIDNATITALSYEPTVLSTLTSNITYFENSGGIPVLRQVPGVRDLLADIPFAPFKMGKRQKGVYQSSVIILEPVVIPTVEDLVRYHSSRSAEG